jgi:hypothetical protein
MCKYRDCRSVTIKSGQARRIIVAGRQPRRLVVRVELREGNDREGGTDAVDRAIANQGYMTWLSGWNVKWCPKGAFK